MSTVLKENFNRKTVMYIKKLSRTIKIKVNPKGITNGIHHFIYKFEESFKIIAVHV